MAQVPFTIMHKTASGYDEMFPETRASQIPDVYSQVQVNEQISNSKADIAKLSNKGWRLLQAYKTAGTVTWTAPDLFNGASYKIGVYIVGGGGYGGSGSSQNSHGTGGGSGYADSFTKIVTPGQVINGVVGEGGKKYNINSGTTSFDSRVVGGGGNGSGGSGASYGMGGQCGVGEYALKTTPIGGFISSIYSMRLLQSALCVNPFTCEPFLAAGGDADSDSAQSSVTTSEGTTSAGAIGTATAIKGTIPGCGGGGAGYKGTPADGCDGGILIYVQGA